MRQHAFHSKYYIEKRNEHQYSTGKAHSPRLMSTNTVRDPSLPEGDSDGWTFSCFPMYRSCPYDFTRIAALCADPARLIQILTCSRSGGSPREESFSVTCALIQR